MRTALLFLFGAVLVTSAPLDVIDATLDDVLKSPELQANITILENATIDEIIEINTNDSVIEGKTISEDSLKPEVSEILPTIDEKLSEIDENTKPLHGKLDDSETKNEKISEISKILFESLDDSETKNVSDENVSEIDEDVKFLEKLNVIENNDSIDISEAVDCTSDSDESSNESIDIAPIIDLVTNSNDTESLQNFTQILNENPKILNSLTSTIAQGDPNLLVSYIFLGKNGLENLFEFLQLHPDILLKNQIDNNDEFEDENAENAGELNLEVLNILKVILINIESNGSTSDTFSDNLNRLREYLVNDTEAMDEFISINNESNYGDIYIGDDDEGSNESDYDASDELIVNEIDESIDVKTNESSIETEIKNSKEIVKSNETENTKDSNFELENESKLIEKSDSIELQLEPTPTNILDETEINVTQPSIEILPESKI